MKKLLTIATVIAGIQFGLLNATDNAIAAVEEAKTNHHAQIECAIDSNACAK